MIDFVQMYSHLNHVGVYVGYSATLSLVDLISMLHTLPLKQWIANDIVFKYTGVIMLKRMKVFVMSIPITKESCYMHVSTAFLLGVAVYQLLI